MGNLIKRNLALKIVSVFVAIILWFIAIRDHNPEITRRFDNVKVTVENETQLEPHGLTLTQRITNETDIQVRGRAHDFIDIDADDFSGFVDLAKVTMPGEQYIPVEIKGLPAGMTLQKTPQIWASIDILDSKEIPVTLDMDVSEANGFRLHPYTLNPEGNVRVLGPSGMLGRVKRATVSLRVNEASQTIERSLPVSLFDENGQLVQHEFISAIPGFIIVTIPVYPVRTLPVITPLAGTPAFGYEVKAIEIYPSEITVSGENEVLNLMHEFATEVLDINNALTDLRRTVRFKSYEGIRIIPGQPANVDVVVRIEETIVENVITISDIQFRNLPQNRRARIEEDNVKVTLRGTKLALEMMADEEIKVYLDLSEVTRGDHNLPLSAEVPDGVELISISPREVTVTVN
jgi:YbbR domain-containing protein